MISDEVFIKGEFVRLLIGGGFNCIILYYVIFTVSPRRVTTVYSAASIDDYYVSSDV